MSELGRPTKYSQEMLERAEKYIETCLIEKQMPFIEELALILGVNDDTIVEWSKDYEEFSATVKRLKMLQKLYLKKGALEKKLHPTLSIFLLKANHGMNENEKVSDPVQIIRVLFYGKDPDTLDQAIYNKEQATEILNKAEQAIKMFSEGSNEQKH